MPLLVSVALVASMTVISPVVSAQAVDMWTTPGTYTSGGRQWRTLDCQPYSATRRCRTEIWGTTVREVDGRFVSSNGWIFNNLTYVAAPRSLWAGNPLATPGYHTIGGRRWYTECDTAKVGANVCKAWVWSRVIAATRNPDYTWSYGWVSKWVYNNQIRFTPDQPVRPCPGERYPTGYTITNGQVHAVKTPYSPNTLYNPTNIANFAMKALRSGNTCLGRYASQQLVAGGTERTLGGVTALWFPYNFAFNANPATTTLEPGWISGLAQGAALTTTRLMYAATDPADTEERAYWLNTAKLIYRSYRVPLSEGGFKHQIPGERLWFEEYPTSPVTTHVLNGHLEAMIALGAYAQWMERLGDPDAVTATALFTRTATDLVPVMAAEAVAVSQGTISSYELVRGYPSAPLRLVSTNASETVVKQVLPSGVTPVTLPLVSDPAGPGPNLLTNGAFTQWSDSTPRHWQVIPGTVVSNDSNAVSWRGNGRGWTGIQQDVSAQVLSANQRYRVTWTGSTDYPTGVRGTSGRVVAYAMCPGQAARYLAENNITRSSTRVRQDMLVKMPSTPGCGLKLQLLQLDYSLTTTTVRFDGLQLRRVGPTGGARLEWPMEVLAAPQSKLVVTGTGTYELQAYEQGRWNTIDGWQATGQAHTVIIPERLTGRNLHWGYHEFHVHELLSVARLCSGLGLADQSAALVDYAQLFRPLAPSKEGLFASQVPQSSQTDPRTQSAPRTQSDPTMPVVDSPFDAVPPVVDPGESNQNQS